MLPTKKQYGLLDRVIIQINRCLDTIATDSPAKRDYPAANIADVALDATKRQQSAGFMRVNHCGEVCAQALYDSQAIFAREETVRNTLQACGEEETDHLAWCHQRLQELDSHRSYLNFFWYVNAFAMGLLAGLLGDKWSLGFVEETEIQVGRHLQGHLEKIASIDKKSCAIIRQMQADEARHADAASARGAAALPEWVKWLMKLHARVMTTLSYWI